jgi:Flp pilus assembly pilin Flp
MSSDPKQTSSAPRDDGASAAEYALLIGLIALVIFIAVGLLGLNVADLFSTVSTAF